MSSITTSECPKPKFVIFKQNSTWIQLKMTSMNKNLKKKKKNHKIERKEILINNKIKLNKLPHIFNPI